MVTRTAIILLICIIFKINLLANDNKKNDHSFQISKDDPIVAMLDSLANLKVYKNIAVYKEQKPSVIESFPTGFVPEYCDSVYKARFDELDRLSPINFVYNSSVKNFINLYAKNRRDLTERIMGLSELYFPYFEEQLDKHGIPLELKYIAVIESALNPVARSRVGATGIWQFMYGTGRMYGLEVNSYVDDRSDIVKSTIAACEHFVDLFNIYDDWLLAMAAYNAGPGNVNRAIRRSGGVRDFWSIRGFLPRETRNYVPAFMAVAYVMEYSDHHNLYPTPPPYTDLDIDTLNINQILSLRNISKILDIPIDHLRYLNPSFRQNIIPGSENNTYTLRLPKKYSGLFVTNEEKIYNYKTPEEIRQEELAAQMRETTVHVVRQGEVLGTIARRYGCTVGEIQRWNNLRGTLIRPGQQLIVRAPMPANTNISTDNNVHVVRSGETLGVISNRYRVSIDSIKRWNNLSSTTIYAGQHLIIKEPEGMTTKQKKKEEEEKGKEKSEKETQAFIYYEVQKGDTLADIADKYPDIEIEQLIKFNNFCENKLKPGQKIILSKE